MSDRYAVIGHPISHSRSPEIHTHFARETAQDMAYERLLAPLDGFPATVGAFVSAGGRGANVTLPFKLEACQFANALTDRARVAGAVNTLKFDGGHVLGDNTDGAGLCRDIIDNLKVPILGARILLLGAGGAARGVLGPLLAAGPRSVVIANRSPSRAAELARQFSALGPVVSHVSPDLATHEFDILINATSASLANELPTVPANCFHRGALAYDLAYGKGPSPFMTLATQAGARSADGLGMLIEQAAEAFFVWRGVRPATAELLAQMRAP